MIIVDGKESADAKIKRLERENADLKLQLEIGVQLRADLHEALHAWQQSYFTVNKSGFKNVCFILSNAYANALKDGAI